MTFEGWIFCGTVFLLSLAICGMYFKGFREGRQMEYEKFKDLPPLAVVPGPAQTGSAAHKTGIVKQPSMEEVLNHAAMIRDEKYFQEV